MGMFGMFGGKKKNGAATGDWGEDMVGMMKMLAGMPGMMRKPMMKGRINQILSLPEDRRQESIREMFGAFHSPKVKDKAREKLVATRIEVVGELPEQKRRTLISSRIVALKAAPHLEEADQRVQDRVLSKVSASARQAFTSTWAEVVKEEED